MIKASSYNIIKNFLKLPEVPEKAERSFHIRYGPPIMMPKNRSIGQELLAGPPSGDAATLAAASLTASDHSRSAFPLGRNLKISSTFLDIKAKFGFQILCRPFMKIDTKAAT